MLRPTIKWLLWATGLLAIWVTALVISWTVAEIKVPINLPSLEVRGGIGHMSVSGTWVIEGDQQAYPLQTIRAFCIKDQKECAVASAQVMSGSQLMLNIDYYEVSTWDNGRVVLTDTSPNCVNYIYTFDLKAKAGNGLRQRKPPSVEAIGDCSNLKAELRLTLKDGGEVSRELRNEAVPQIGKLLVLPIKLFF